MSRGYSVKALVVLHHLAQHGSQTRVQLLAAQDRWHPGRTEAAREAQLYNLAASGLVRRKLDGQAGPAKLWEVTTAGRRLLEARRVELPPEPAATQPSRPAARPRTVVYDGRKVPLPRGPRWVFDVTA